LGTHIGLNAAYTQLMYWQVYAKSQYFRETNYAPELFLSRRVFGNWIGNIGAVHQSNGRGGDMERSWNRVYAQAIFSHNNFALSIRPWLLIFKSISSERHNKDIDKYLGYGDITLAYKFGPTTLSLLLRNHLESGFKRGATELDYSFPISQHVRGYIQFFSGFGQSLIEYNHFTNGAGIGIALSDWI
jgi:phospholipase A1/A2